MDFFVLFWTSLGTLEVVEETNHWMYIWSYFNVFYALLYGPLDPQSDFRLPHQSGNTKLHLS